MVAQKFAKITNKALEEHNCDSKWRHK